MTKQLIIRLSGQAQGNIPWLVWDNEAHAVLQQGQLDHAEALVELAELALDCNVQVLVSSTEIGFHLLELPPGSRRHLAQVVPYALEEELAQDIHELHFAWFAGGAKGDALPVAVVAREQMTQWLSWLEQAGIECKRLIPDLFILPVEEDEWSAIALDDDIVVRHQRWRGFAIESTLFAELAGLFSDALTPPQRIRCWGDVQWPQAPANLTAAEDELPPLALARYLANDQAINLLQGDFAQRRKQRSSLGVWRWPGIAAAVLLGMVFVDKGLQVWQLDRQQSELQAAIEQTYRDTFPGESRVVNVRAQLNQHLNRLQDGSGGSQVLTLLQQLGPAFEEVNLDITLLQYDQGRNELRIQASGADFLAFERFQQLAREANLSIEQGQLNSRGGRIAGTLIVRGQS